MKQSVKFFYRSRKLAVPEGTSKSAGRFPGGRRPIMRNPELDTPAYYEAYEHPPSDAYLACFGLFIFTGIVAAFYVLLMGS
jgi:hypothetical protein